MKCLWFGSFQGYSTAYDELLLESHYLSYSRSTMEGGETSYKKKKRERLRCNGEASNRIWPTLFINFQASTELSFYTIHHLFMFHLL